MRRGLNQYAPMQGVPLLRQRIAEKVHRLYRADVDPDTEITVTSGATEALYAAITAVVHPGDEVIVIEPAFDSYVPAIELNRGVPRVRTHDLPPIRCGLGSGRIIAYAPHPTDHPQFAPQPNGNGHWRRDIKALQNITAGHPLYILSDEVYEHIIFDGRQHESMLRYPDLAARSFVISSFGKTYHTTGWKIGYCIAPELLSKEFRSVHQFPDLCKQHPPFSTPMPNSCSTAPTT
jgi:methionine aminotransferase